MDPVQEAKRETAPRIAPVEKPRSIQSLAVSLLVVVMGIMIYFKFGGFITFLYACMICLLRWLVSTASNDNNDNFFKFLIISDLIRLIGSMISFVIRS